MSRRRGDLIKLEEADAEEQAGHAFRVMDAYVRSFEQEGTERGRQGDGERERQGDGSDVSQSPDLLVSPSQYPWQSPRHDLAEARRLIEKHGHLRRLPELEDAEAAILASA